MLDAGTLVRNWAVGVGVDLTHTVLLPDISISPTATNQVSAAHNRLDGDICIIEEWIVIKLKPLGRPMLMGEVDQCARGWRGGQGSIKYWDTETGHWSLLTGLEQLSETFITSGPAPATTFIINLSLPKYLREEWNASNQSMIANSVWVRAHYICLIFWKFLKSLNTCITVDQQFCGK